LQKSRPTLDSVAFQHLLQDSGGRGEPRRNRLLDKEDIKIFALMPHMHYPRQIDGVHGVLS
jgi:hypothetical protein